MAVICNHKILEKIDSGKWYILAVVAFVHCECQVEDAGRATYLDLVSYMLVHSKTVFF